MPNFIATCSLKSTSHLDLLAEWNEPPRTRQRRTRDANRERSDTRVSGQDHAEPTRGVCRDGADYRASEGEFDPHRRQSSTTSSSRSRTSSTTRATGASSTGFEATTKFREFMPPDILTELGGTDRCRRTRTSRSSGRRSQRGSRARRRRRRPRCSTSCRRSAGCAARARTAHELAPRRRAARVP